MQLFAFLNKPEIIQFSELMFEESRAHPEIAKVFYDAAYGRTHRRLTEYNGSRADSRGWVIIALNADEAAEAILNL